MAGTNWLLQMPTLYIPGERVGEIDGFLISTGDWTDYALWDGVVIIAYSHLLAMLLAITLDSRCTFSLMFIMLSRNYVISLFFYSVLIFQGI